MELGIAVMRIANHADEVGQPGGEITQILKVFAFQTQPLLDAAASRDPERIRQAQEAAKPLFHAGVAYAEQWSRRIERGEEQVKTARHVWDAIMLSAAAYEAAAGLAGIAARGPPNGPFMFAGGSAAAGAVPSVELVEALRKLIAMGALDAAVVASLGKLTSPPTPGVAVPLPDPSLPAISQMADPKRGEPVWSEYGRKHVASAKVPWAETVESTKSGPAKYLPGTDVEALERQVWREGTAVTTGKTWKVMEMPRDVGASGGKLSRWVRVEESAGTIHGHPITEVEFRNLTRPP
jgi:hypothetical protein